MSPAKRRALLIIDLQQGLVDERHPLWQRVLETVAQVTRSARRHGVLPIFVQHAGPRESALDPKRNGFLLHPLIRPLGSEPIFVKRWSDLFYETALESWLHAQNVSHLLVTGAVTEYCVDTTVRRAASLGFNVTLIADGHATHGNAVFSPHHIIEHHNLTLANLATPGVSIRVVPAANLVWSPTETP